MNSSGEIGQELGLAMLLGEDADASDYSAHIGWATSVSQVYSLYIWQSS